MAREFSANLLCLIGVAIGAVGILLPFVSWQTQWSAQGLSTVHPADDALAYTTVLPGPPIDLLNLPSIEMIYSPMYHSYYSHMAMFDCFFAAFIMGIVLSLLTPLAGFLELIGASGCLATISFMRITMSYGSVTWDIVPVPDIGAWLMLISSLIVITSFFVSPLLQLPETKVIVQPRSFCTFSFMRKADSKTRSGFRINSVALAGASLALIGALLPWEWEFGSRLAEYYSPIAALAGSTVLGERIIFIAMLLMIFIILSFISPLSGSFLLPTALVLSWFPEGIGTESSNMEAGSGLVVSVCASAVIILGYFMVIENNRIVWKTNLENRIWTINRSSRRKDPVNRNYDNEYSSGPVARLNILAVSASLLGLASIFMPWLLSQSFLTVMSDPLTLGIAIATALFFVGLVANFITTLGCVLQTIGYAIFIVVWLDVASEGIPLGIGALLAICSIVIGVIGIANPIFLPERYEKRRLLRRLLSIIPNSKAES